MCYILFSFFEHSDGRTQQGRPFISHKSDQSGPLLEFVITLVAYGLHNVVTVYSCEEPPTQHFSPSSHPADQFEVEETVCHQPELADIWCSTALLMLTVGGLLGS